MYCCLLLHGMVASATEMGAQLGGIDGSMCIVMLVQHAWRVGH